MDVGTIVVPLVVLGGLALFLIMLRRLPPAEDDVAVVVAAILGTPDELERPPADIEEPVRWRIDRLVPTTARRSNGANRSKRHDVAKPLAPATL
jgi:hypothetical protein